MASLVRYLASRIFLVLPACLLCTQDSAALEVHFDLSRLEADPRFPWLPDNMDFGNGIRFAGRGYVDDVPDPDLANALVSRTLSTVSPTFQGGFSERGFIIVLGGMIRSVSFKYGMRNNLHSDTTGGFTAFTQSNSSQLRSPSLPGSVFKQFALNEGQPIGPVTLAAPSADALNPMGGRINPYGQQLFNQLTWTSGTRSDDMWLINRGGPAQIADIVFDVVPNAELLRGSVNRVANQYLMELEFRPTFGGAPIPIVDMEAALEVQGGTINWLQRVTHLPRGWKANVMAAEWTDQNRPFNHQILESDIGTGFIDHIVQDTPGLEKTMLFQCDDTTSNGDPLFVWWRQELEDDDEAYWRPEAKDIVRTETSSVFWDEPKQPLGSLDLNDSEDYFGFETRLVARGFDGKLRDLSEEFPGMGLKWSWKSNTMADSDSVSVQGGIYGAAGDGGYPPSSNINFGPPVAGGIFDVASDLVTSNSLPGDYDNSGTVDLEDYEVWKVNFGTSVAIADGNSNGVVDAADYTIWRDNFGTGSGSVVSVPEPHALMCIAIGVISLAGRCAAFCFRGHSNPAR